MQSTAYKRTLSDCKPSIIEVVEQYFQLRRTGKEFFGVCPFHPDKRPSLSVNEEKGLFHCFACGTSGDVIRFVELIENISFPEACARLNLETFKPRPRPHRIEAEKIARWAQETSKSISAALRAIGDEIYICSLARKEPGADRELIRAVEVELIRRWAILEDFDDDLNNSALVLELWRQRRDVEHLVELS
ncbi:MAG: CHC2 zinc finger domain-containing protein [Candidatus Binatia bacterium]